MPDIIATDSGNLDDGGFNTTGGSSDSFSDLHNKTTANSWLNAFSGYSVGHGSNIIGSLKTFYRALLNFDLSGADAGTVESATVKIYQAPDIGSGFFTRVAQTDEHFHLCKAQAGASFTTADFNAMTGWVSSGTYDGNVTEYATKISQQGSAAWNTWTLNSTAISDINSAIGTSSVQMMILTSQDFDDADYGTPYISGFLGIHGVFFNSAEATNKPTLSIEYATAATDNAPFFGCNF